MNTATGHATFDGDPVDSNEDQVTVTAVQASALRLVKVADRDEFWKPGQSIGYEYRVTNTGNIRLHGPVTVSDDRVEVTCPAVTTVGDGDAWLDPGERIDCTATETTTEDDVAAEEVVNHATATADGVDSNEDTVRVPFVAGLPCVISSFTFSVPPGRNPYPMAEVTISANSRLVEGCSVSWSLASYAAEGPTWETSGTQQLVEHDGVTIDNDNPSGTLRVALPDCYGQTDLYPGLRVYDGVDGPLPRFPDSRVPPDNRSWSIGGDACDATVPLMQPPAVWFDAGRSVDSQGLVPLRVRWRATDPGEGIVSSTGQKQVGSGSWVTIATLGSTTPSVPTTVDPARGTIRVRARATDGAGNRSAWMYGPRLKVRTWGEGSRVTTATGGWTSVIAPTALGGERWRSVTNGAELTFSAPASRSVGLVAVTGPDRGRVRLIVDGVPGPVVDLYSRTRDQRRMVWSIRSTSAVTRTVTVEVLPGHHPASTGRSVELDAFLTIQAP